ncbi:hypothetical protein OUZ56_032552 [Daphnia magna]|uniref:Uncharacterized protein n=1 Tax=Daphnia magna TaxID=35525 RepID=A0ABR0B977_9CRUS|nr:hypothetical protein OUZ56_032552 [Daphnia magna]
MQVPRSSISASLRRVARATKTPSSPSVAQRGYLSSSPGSSPSKARSTSGEHDGWLRVRASAAPTIPSRSSFFKCFSLDLTPCAAPDSNQRVRVGASKTWLPRDLRLDAAHRRAGRFVPLGDGIAKSNAADFCGLSAIALGGHMQAVVVGENGVARADEFQLCSHS